MFNTLGSLVIGYFAVCGGITAVSVAGRGLLRAADSASRGDYEKAGEDALAAVVAPAVLAYDATATLVSEVAGKARELGKPALERACLPR
jgi:hypothetical protein